MHLKRILTVAVLSAGTLGIAGPATASTDGIDFIGTRTTGSKEVPGPGDANGKGNFNAALTADSMCYRIAAKKIETPVAAHIHVGGVNVAGPVVITLQVPTQSGVTECIKAVPDGEDTSVTMSETELDSLRSAPRGFYVNVHTPSFPAGAIRGQL